MDTVRDAIQTAEATETIVCRPEGGMVGVLWTLFVVEALLVLLTFANIFLASGIVWSGDLIVLLAFNACILPLCVYTGLYVRRACVISDVKGLRWRQVSRWQEVDWENVTAFYGYRHSGSGSSSRAKLSVKVITSDGSPVLVLSPEEWSSSAEMLKSIKRNVREVSGPGLSGPQVKQNSVLPLTCRYDTSINRNILGWLDNLHKYGLLAVAVYFVYQWFTTHMLPGWEWLLTPTGLFVVVKQTLPLLCRPLYRATQPKLGDKVMADQEGLRFVTTQSETTIRWGDITGFYRAGIRYVVVTDAGKYDFLDTLTDVERLRTIIPRLAVNACQKNWKQSGGRYGTHRQQ